MENLCAAPIASPRRPEWHHRFIAMLPAIESHAKRAFRGLSALDREEAVQAVVAYAAVAYERLNRLQKADRGRATPLARFGVKQYRAGRLIGGQVNSRDVGSASCWRRGCVVESLEGRKDSVGDRRSKTPAEIAELRLDLGDWFNSLSLRDRRLAGALASGEQTCRIAQKFELTSGRVSQIRRELHDSWRRFIGDRAAAEC